MEKQLWEKKPESKMMELVKQQTKNERKAKYKLSALNVRANLN